MTFSALDTVLYTLAFLVPGFIINSIFSRFCSEDDQETQLLLLRFLTFSAINYALWSGLLYLVFRFDFFALHPLATACVWVLVIFISPIVLGLVFGYVEQRRFLWSFFEKYGIDIAGIDNLTAWDNTVLSFSEAQYVLVTLTDRHEIRGVLGGKSLATKQSKGGDIYLEKVMVIDPSNPTGPWIEVENCKGVWVKGSEMRYFEFWG